MSKTETAPFSIKSASFDAVRVVIATADLAELRAALASRLAAAGSFFDNDPVVVDTMALDERLDWPELIALLREYRMQPIGAVAVGENLLAAAEAGIAPLPLRAPVAPRGASAAGHEGRDGAALTPSGPATQADASAAPPATGGGVDPAGSVAPDASVTAQPVAADAHPPEPAPNTIVIDRPMRSGQRVYARGGDAVVIGLVSNGAEVIADGNVHIYGPLRGKAMAGARGDTTARVFCTHLDPELIGIAGVYRTTDTPLPPEVRGQLAQVRLDGDKLIVEPLRAQ
ncbi:septum site-determining protein MinC [Derxia gummosa]|uniref:Probable septum site-determining protein MinC n=1 Tax=Derxia gummosa DSM 723 TaxID=1121388 RepID=A0A8B6X4W5_9BURK|nr:septum site-determining protein MinC [Derxia gummosa]